MKFRSFIFLVLMGVFSLTVVACSNNDASTSLEHNFPSADMSQYDIAGDHRFYDVTMYEALQLRDDASFNGIIYFGFPACPWCQAAVPVMHKASQQTETDVFYVSRHADLREGEWLEWDHSMALWLDEQIEMEWIYEEIDAEEAGNVGTTPIRPNIFVPQIVHLRNGIIVDDHRGTLEGHNREDDDGHLPELTDAEHATLLETYIRIFSGVHEPELCPLDDTTVDESCS